MHKVSLVFFFACHKFFIILFKKYNDKVIRASTYIVNWTIILFKAHETVDLWSNTMSFGKASICS